MKTLIFAVALLASASTAHAATYTSLPGAPDPGFGPGETLLYDFEGPGGGIGGAALSGSFSLQTGPIPGAAPPAGDATQYVAVPATTDLSSSGTATLSLAGLPKAIKTFSFYWGSVDEYNTLDLFSGATKIFTLHGTDLPRFDGDQLLSSTNRRVYFDVAGDNIDSLVFTSTNRAFEFDDLAVSYVPEPATWGMLIVGFGLIGAAARKRRHANTVVA